MTQTKENRSNAEQVYEREFQLVQRVRELDSASLSREELLEEYTRLGKEYEKLLRQTIKITRIGDANQRILIGAKEQIEYQKEELSVAYKKLDLIARMDPLTNLSNRRDFLERFNLEIIRFERNRKPFSLVLGDIDDFKLINDRYGHDCGDFILARLAQMMKEMIRKQDAVARWGGEEFIFLLPESPQEGGRVAAESIRQKIAVSSFAFQGNRLSITVTLGVSEYDGSTDIDGTIKLADEALYIGKQQGKNCVILSERFPGEK